MVVGFLSVISNWLVLVLIYSGGVSRLFLVSLSSVVICVVDNVYGVVFGMFECGVVKVYMLLCVVMLMMLVLNLSVSVLLVFSCLCMMCVVLSVGWLVNVIL